MDAKNLLFIMSDQHDPRHMGVSGHPVWGHLARTPNLDRLAENGTRFTSAYTTCPICVPARASFATGRYVHEIGYWDNAMGYDGRVEGWGHELQRRGVRVESIGKLHYRNEQDPTGFDAQHNPMHIWNGIGQVWGSNRRPLERARSRVAPDGTLPSRPGAEPRRMYEEVGAGWSSYNAYDDDIAGRTADWLGRHATDENPWVLYVGFVAPHFPLVVPQEYLDRFPFSEIPDPKLHPRDGHARHPWNFAIGMSDAEFADPARRRLAMAAYLGLCSYLDHQIGRVLEALEARGLQDSTRVIYTSDHGETLGARGMWGKSCLYEEATAIPLILAGPDVPAGATVDTPVDLVDCAPTILAAAQVAPTLPFEGVSLYERIGAARDDERIAFSEYHAAGSPSAAFMLRQGPYKYHYYVGYEPELFNLDADPEETTNLAANPDCAPVLAALEKSLRERLDPEETDARAKADQDALIERFGGPEAVRTLGTPGATPTPGAGPE